MDISYSELRQNLKKTIDFINDTHEPMFINSHHARKAVLLSYEDYESLAETAYLLRSPAMAKRLINAVTDIKSKKNVIVRKLIDEA